MTKLALLLLCGVLGACSRSSERRSDEAISQRGVWQRAFATVEYGPPFYKNGRDYPAHVAHTLSIKKDADPYNGLYVILTQRSEGEASPALFSALRKTKYTLRWAADGHALAASTDGGKAWTVFDLSAAEEALTVPFYCAHQRFGTLDPWPDVRAQVLEVLRETSPSSTTHVHRAPVDAEQPISQNRDELFDAALYACKKRDADPALRAALIDAYTSPWKGASSSRGGDNSVLPACLGAMAKSDPAVLARLREAATRLTDPADQGRVKFGLYFVDHPAR
jgi:hypothetical protein